MNRIRLAAADPELATRFLYRWLLVALFVEYARPASYFPFLRIPFLYSVIPLLLFAVSLFAQGLRPRREIFADPIAKWIFVFLGLIAVSILHAEVTEFSYKIFKLVLGYVLLFVTVARIVTTVERLRGVIITLFSAHLFLLIMNPVVVTDPNTRHYVLGASFLGDGNDFSLSLCILFPCLIEAALSARSWRGKALLWGGVALTVLAIIATQSRGASLGIAVVLFYLWLRSSRKMLSIIGLAAVGVIVLIYAPPAYFQRMGTIAEYQTEGSAQGRIEAWKSSVKMAVDNPVLGVGAGHFAIAFGTKYRTKGSEGMPWLTAHSSYFLVLGELGTPGIACLMMLVFGNFRANTRLRSRILAKAAAPPESELVEKGAVDIDYARLLYLTSAAVLGFAVAGAFLSAAYYPHLFVLTGILISARNIAARATGLPVVEGRGRNDRAAGRRALRKPRQTTAAAGNGTSESR